MKQRKISIDILKWYCRIKSPYEFLNPFPNKKQFLHVITLQVTGIILLTARLLTLVP